ncbi:MAG: DUF4132 domain-containing protein, partial [Gemmataceae bacterium]
ALIDSWPDDRFFNNNDAIDDNEFMIFGLGSKKAVIAAADRLNLNFNIFGQSPDRLTRMWLAHTGTEHLGRIVSSLEGMSKSEIGEIMKPLVLVKDPVAAPHMLELLTTKAAQYARQWFEENPGNGMVGVMPLLAGRGKVADAAKEYLLDMKRKGHTQFISDQLKDQPTEVKAAVEKHILNVETKVIPKADASSLPKELTEALAEAAKQKPAKLPSWADAATMPPLVVGGQLPDDAVKTLLTVLATTKPQTPCPPLVTALLKHADVQSRDAFAWKLFTSWQGDGFPSKDKWAFYGLGYLGGDASVFKLTPMIREWPGESQHARAVTGLEVLSLIGTDTALMSLNGIAQKVKFQGLKKKAQEMMELIATSRNMTRNELEDRIVPDLDLNEKGGRTFDFGPRQFRMILGADLAPVISDSDGKQKNDLPKPGKSDDSTKAEAAVAEWKLLKKQLKETLKIQAPRLEQAMVTGRRWKIADFQALLMKHPLMTNLVQRLVWASYSKDGKRTDLFRVNEEQETTSSDDRPMPLQGETVGIVHPLHLNDDEKAKWGQMFGDYEIIPPFPQLGRPVLSATPAELKEKHLKQFLGGKINTYSVIGALEKDGWVRGIAADGGMVTDYSKLFPAANVRAVLLLDPGYPIGYMDYSNSQAIKMAYFIPGTKETVGWMDGKDAMELKKVDPLAISEVLATLRLIGSTTP